MYPSSEDIKRDRPCFDRSFFVDLVRNDVFSAVGNFIKHLCKSAKRNKFVRKSKKNKRSNALQDKAYILYVVCNAFVFK